MEQQSTTASRVFRFGVFEANEATQELRKQGIRIKLHAQPFRVLVMLLERPGELVTREEMRLRLWGEETFVDFDHGLNTAINKLREALNDSASQPRYVETISGRGYRFIAPVTLATSLAREAPEVTTPTVATTPEEDRDEKAALTPDTARLASAAQPAADASPQVVSRAGLAPNSPPKAPEPYVADQTSGISSKLLTSAHELPRAPRQLVKFLLLATQLMYLAFYLGALANLPEIHGIFVDSRLAPPLLLMTLLVTTAVVLIPVRLYLFAAVSFDFQKLAEKFRRLFPVLLPLDLLWALSPFLLIHHVSGGLALGLTAALVYMPFAQRSLVLMYARGHDVSSA